MELVDVCTYTTLYRSVESEIIKKITLKYETQRMTPEESREWGMHCTKYLVTVSLINQKHDNPSIVLIMFTEDLPEMWIVFALMMCNAHAVYNSYDLESFCKKYKLTENRAKDIYHFCDCQQQLLKSVVGETMFMRMLTSVDVLHK